MAKSNRPGAESRPYRWLSKCALKLCALGCFWVVSLFLVSGCTSTTVIRDAKVIVPIFVGADSGPFEKAAAEELARVLAEMSDAPCKIETITDLRGPGFYVGRGLLEKVQGRPLELAADPVVSADGGFGPDGFRVLNARGRICIGGATPEATRHAVCWFLQKHAGVRWYTPGADGEMIPKKTRWSVGRLDVSVNPVYFSRELTGLQTPEEKIWAERNGLRQRLDYSHALDRVFPRSILAQQQAWNSLLSGERYLPESIEDRSWQPNFSAPGIAEHAATLAHAALSADQQKVYSFSLGINDSVRYDESAETQATVMPLRYFRGRPDYSSLVFGFMNRVSENLDTKLSTPGYLGCLAYFWCENVPPFRVHPRVLPYLTADRSQYYDRDFRQEDSALMAAWAKSGVKTFGLWEYAYGRNFLVPRQPLNALADAVRKGHALGARGYIAEVEPHWGFDGFKMWMLTQLLWDPTHSTEDLKADFFRGYFREAAVPMQRFFETCETLWLRQQGEPHWLKYFQHEDQILLFSPDSCAVLGQLLAEAGRRAAASPAVGRRVARTAAAFAVAERFAEYDRLRRTLAAQPDDNNLEGVLRDLVPKFSAARTRFETAVAQAREGDLPAFCDGETSNFTRNDPVPAVLWRLGKRSPATPLQMLRGWGAAQKIPHDWLQLAQGLSDAQPLGTSLVSNGDFRATSSHFAQPLFLHPRPWAIPEGWSLRAMPTEHGSLAVTEDLSGISNYVRITGAWDTQLYQWQPAEPEKIYLATCDSRGRRSPGGDAALFLVFLSGEGAVLGHRRMHGLPTGENPGWRELCATAVSPSGAAWVGVGVGVTRQDSLDWVEIRRMTLHTLKSRPNE